MNGLEGVLACLETGVGEIVVPEPTRGQALVCIERMLDFVAGIRLRSPACARLRAHIGVEPDATATA